MFICECGGLMLVIATEKPLKNLSEEKQMIYNRVCDVECQGCGKILYSQPYDSGTRINDVRKTVRLQ
jgi:hypothetical protein